MKGNNRKAQYKWQINLLQTLGKKNNQNPLVSLHPELCDLHIPTVVLSLGKRKGLGHSPVLSRYARKKNNHNLNNLLPSLKKKHLTKALYNLS